jgi:hypothetical protein
MSNLIAPNTIGLLIQTAGAIIVALITYVVGPILVSQINKKIKKTAIKEPPKPLFYTIAGGCVAAITFVVIGLILNNVSPCPPFSPPKITITAPTSDTSVPRLTIVQGFACHIPKDKELWLLVLPDVVASYYPQPGPVEKLKNGVWSASAYIGSDNPNDIGMKFTLIAALADQQGSAAIRTYFDQSGPEYIGFEPLPQGIQIMAQVQVKRK